MEPIKKFLDPVSKLVPSKGLPRILFASFALVTLIILVLSYFIWIATPFTDERATKSTVVSVQGEEYGKIIDNYDPGQEQSWIVFGHYMGSNIEIDRVVHDRNAVGTRTGVLPVLLDDYLSYKLNREGGQGDAIGFIHSHPVGYDKLSGMDKRIMELSKNIDFFGVYDGEELYLYSPESPDRTLLLMVNKFRGSKGEGTLVSLPAEPSETVYIESRENLHR